MFTIVSALMLLLVCLLGSGLWIGLALGTTGSVMLLLFRDIPVDKLIAQYTWNILTTQELLSLPMFIVMGEILFRTRLSRSLFDGLAPWASLLPGRLLHVNVIGSHNLCGGLRLVGSHHSGGGTHLADRVAPPRLRRFRRRGQPCRRRYARLSDPAVEHHDHLWRAG